MPIDPTTLMAQVRGYIDRQMQVRRDALLRDLSVAGEMAVNAARTAKSYTDRTGNLRGSIGYVVVEDGRVVEESGFGQVQAGAQGPRDGRDYARSLASKFPSGIVLIVVAGMNYAAYVSARGYDVLDSAEAVAERMVQKLKNK